MAAAWGGNGVKADKGAGARACRPVQSIVRTLDFHVQGLF